MSTDLALTRPVKVEKFKIECLESKGDGKMKLMINLFMDFELMPHRETWMPSLFEYVANYSEWITTTLLRFKSEYLVKDACFEMNYATASNLLWFCTTYLKEYYINESDGTLANLYQQRYGIHTPYGDFYRSLYAYVEKHKERLTEEIRKQLIHPQQERQLQLGSNPYPKLFDDLRHRQVQQAKEEYDLYWDADMEEEFSKEEKRLLASSTEKQVNPCQIDFIAIYNHLKKEEDLANLAKLKLRVEQERKARRVYYDNQGNKI